MKPCTKALALASIVLAVAINTARAGEPGRGPVAEKLATLGVTDDQKEQVRAILRKHLPTAQPLVRQLVDERRKLRDTIRAAELDEKAIRAQAAKVAAIEADLAVERARIVQEIKPLLTPEQLEKLKDLQLDVEERIDHALAQVAKRIGED